MQLNKLKLKIKDVTKLTLKVSSNVFGDSNDENNFLHELLLTKSQVSRLRKAFENGSSASIHYQIIHYTLSRLLKTGLP